MGRPSLDTGGEIAVIDLVAHLYSTKGLRRDLCAIWDRYSAATTEERKQKGFEIVRNYHSQLTRMFRDGTFWPCTCLCFFDLLSPSFKRLSSIQLAETNFFLFSPKYKRERESESEKKGAQKLPFACG